MDIASVEREWDKLNVQFVTLNEVKKYLNIDSEDTYYDELLTGYIQASFLYIIKMAGSAWIVDTTCINLAKILQKKLIADLFENRTTEISNSTKRDIMVNSILDALAIYGE